jgi:RNA polymerase sigma factor (sigma-70 family)
MTPTDINVWLAREIFVHERPLRAHIARFLSEPSDVEDVLQETYARLLSLNDAARANVREWRGFLFATARNVALDRLRKARVVSLDALAEIEGLHVIDEQLTAFEQLSARQELAMLAQAIASLPERCRQVLTLRKLYGLSQKEISRQLGIAESTVEKHVAHGVRLCAQRMFALANAGSTSNVEAIPGSTTTVGSNVKGSTDVE